MGRRVLVVFGICIGVSAVALDWSIVVTALPVMQRDLNLPTSELQWIMNAFGILSTTFMVTSGRLADDFGRKKFFLGSLILFVIGLVLAGSSNSGGMLIFARCVQGLATSVLLPSSQSLVRLAYPPEEVGKGMAIWSCIVGLFLALGPVAGGIIISFLGWRWIFYIAIPAVIISFIICAFALEDKKEEHNRKDLDWYGLLCLILVIGPLSMAITEGPNWGWGSAIIIALFILSVVAIIALYFAEKRAKVPIIQPEFFLHRNFLGGALGALIFGFLIWVIFFLTPLFLHNIKGEQPLFVGLNMLWVSFPLFVLAPFAGKWQAKKGAKVPILTGFFCMLASTILLHFIDYMQNDLWYLSLALLVFGVGWGIMWGPILSVGVSAMKESLSTMAAGAIMTVQDMGGVLGVAISGTLFREIANRYLSNYLYENNVSVSQRELDHLNKNIADPEVGGFLENVMRDGFMDAWDNIMYLMIFLTIISIVSVFFILKENNSTEDVKN